MGEDKRTVWCGNLPDKVTEELLYELFLQAAPLERVCIPTDKEGRRSNFGFVTMKHEVSVDYAVQLLNGTSLYDRRLNIKPRTGGQNNNVQHKEPASSPLAHQKMMNNFNDLIAMGRAIQGHYSHQNNYDNRPTGPNHTPKHGYNKPYNRHQNKSDNYTNRTGNNRRIQRDFKERNNWSHRY